MSKKLFAACLVIAAFAVVPSLASANPILTEPTGTALAAGSRITATNVGITKFHTSTGDLECTKATLTGSLTSNATGTGAKGEIEKATFAGTGPETFGEKECTGTNVFLTGTTVTPALNLPWCLEAPAAADSFTLKGGPCGSPREIKFNLDMTEIGTCEYSRTSTVNGTLVTDSGGSNENTLAITAVPWTKIGGPGLCPSTGELTMRFSLETDSADFGFIFISP